MLPWARCVVACHLRGWRMISPQWHQWDVFSIWQRNRDRRWYTGIFRPDDSAVNGFLRLRTLLSLPHISEPDWPALELPESSNDAIVVFSGLGRYFTDLLNHREVVRRALRAIAVETRTPLKRNTIAVHVRLGDFAPADASDPDQSNRRTELDWYIGRINDLRALAGEVWPVEVYSDGSDQELGPVLSLAETRRTDDGVMGSILSMAGASALIASGSTFSMWAAYLGGMPVIWPANQMRQPMHPQEPAREIEWSSESEVTETFINAARDHEPSPIFD